MQRIIQRASTVVNDIVCISFKGNQKGNIKCYARERANTKQPFWTVITFLTSVVY